MIVKSYKTHKINAGDDLYKIFDKYLPSLNENSIVAITSKIVSICQKDVIKIGDIDKEELIKKESDYYVETDIQTPYGNVFLTRKDDHIVFSAGIDESNADGHYILWPKDLQETVNNIWEYLRKKNKIKNLGVIVTDSRFNPGRTGTLGFGMSWCGFNAINDYVGKNDIFGRKIEWVKVNIIDSLGTAAALVMGETNEQTPLSVFTDVDFVKFQQRVPNKKEMSDVTWPLEKDLYGKLLTAVRWQKGGNGK